MLVLAMKELSQYLLKQDYFDIKKYAFAKTKVEKKHQLYGAKTAITEL